MSFSAEVIFFTVQGSMFCADLIGTVDVPDSGVGYGYGYEWATVRSAYDSVNQRSYYFEDSVLYLSLLPHPFKENTTIYRDYPTNAEYQVYTDGSCTKRDIDEPMFIECIPGNATFTGETTLGDSNTTMRHYLFYDRIYFDPYQVTISVVHSAANFSECTPVRVSYSSAYVFQSDHNVDITIANTVDVNPGIRDHSIFDPPELCKKQEPQVKDDTEPSTIGRMFFPNRLAHIGRKP